MLGPVAIGGVGGSGTRLVKEIITSAGFYMGNDLHRVNGDDLWFNLLFFRPNWYLSGAARRNNAIDIGLNLVAKHAHGDHRLSASEMHFLVRAFVDIARDHHFGRNSWRWALRRIYNFFRSPGVTQAQGLMGWGWKEPLTHLIAGELLQHSEQARYIHIIRHGLDMAFSSNLNQARRYGALFDVVVPQGKDPSPIDTLRYWVRANRSVVNIMQQHSRERSLILNFDALCKSPEQEVRRLLAFLEVDLKQHELSKLVSLPKTPASAGRYKNHDLSIFDQEDLQAVRDLGFAIQV